MANHAVGISFIRQSMRELLWGWTDRVVRIWDRMFKLDHELFLWVEEEELGEKKVVCHKGRSYSIQIPKEVDTKTLRLKGLGKARFHKKGDLLLHVRLNRGKDARKTLWISETSAKNGTKLFIGQMNIRIVIPRNSYDGLTLRLKGLGRGPGISPRFPVLDQEKRGDLLVKLSVYPDKITPKYGFLETLSTDNLALEGWVYQICDDVIRKLGTSLPAGQIQTTKITDLFNEGGLHSIFKTLVDHLSLTNLNISLSRSASISQPGNCETTTFVDNMVSSRRYRITINERFLDNPFSIAAIIAHELCHVLYSEKIDDTPKSGNCVKSEKATLEEERTIDLLVFMVGLGQFQLRVARGKRLVLGYFNQEVFERIYVIASRKLGSS